MTTANAQVTVTLGALPQTATLTLKYPDGTTAGTTTASGYTGGTPALSVGTIPSGYAPATNSSGLYQVTGPNGTVYTGTTIAAALLAAEKANIYNVTNNNFTINLVQSLAVPTLNSITTYKGDTHFTFPAFVDNLGNNVAANYNPSGATQDATTGAWTYGLTVKDNVSGASASSTPVTGTTVQPTVTGQTLQAKVNQTLNIASNTIYSIPSATVGTDSINSQLTAVTQPVAQNNTGSATASVDSSGNLVVKASQAGVYTFTATYTDTYGNTASALITVDVTTVPALPFTGGQGMMPIIALSALTGMGMLGALIYLKKSNGEMRTNRRK